MQGLAEGSGGGGRDLSDGAIFRSMQIRELCLPRRARVWRTNGLPVTIGSQAPPRNTTSTSHLYVSFVDPKKKKLS